MVFDSVKVKESSPRNALFLEDLQAGTLMGVIGEEPGCANRDNAGCGGNFGVYIFAKSVIELLGSDKVGW